MAFIYPLGLARLLSLSAPASKLSSNHSCTTIRAHLEIDMPGEPARFSSPCVGPANLNIEDFARKDNGATDFFGCNGFKLPLSRGVQLLVCLEQMVEACRLHGCLLSKNERTRLNPEISDGQVDAQTRRKWRQKSHVSMKNLRRPTRKIMASIRNLLDEVMILCTRGVTCWVPVTSACDLASHL